MTEGYDKMVNQAKLISDTGLRTMALAYKELTPDQVKEFRHKLLLAKLAPINAEGRIE